MKPLKLNKEIVNLITPRLNDEHTASIFYRNAANYCEGVGHMIAAEYFKKESADELVHAGLWESYLNGWNVLPKIGTIEEQEMNFKGLYDVIEKAYAIEKNLYEAYEGTTADVLKTGDMCTFFYLAQFNEFQRKSVAEYSDMINILEGCDEESKFELLQLEEQLFGG